jgi:hypothetical protein
LASGNGQARCRSNEVGFRTYGVHVIVCSCNVLSDADILSCVIEHDGKRLTPAQVHRCLGSRPLCGCCAKSIRSITRDAHCACAAEECAVLQRIHVVQASVAMQSEVEVLGLVKG